MGTFFNDLNQVYDKYKFQCQDVYNVDETAVTTVQTPTKIIARKRMKQVGAVTSAERGTLVTVALAVNAVGNSIPPFFVFPRKNFRDYFLANGPEGSAGSANKSGWMTGQDFKSFMRHFIYHSRATKERPVLLLLDNHKSHLDISVLDLAKESGVVLLSFTPHTSHKLQPLDRSVFGSFKKFVNRSSDAWMRNNAGKTMTIYDVPFIVRQVLPNAITPKNIKAGFLATGTWPFNRDIFTEDDFLPSAVTDRPTREDEVAPLAETGPQAPPTNVDVCSMPSTSRYSKEPEQTNEDFCSMPTSSAVAAHTMPKITHHVSPEVLRPFPKAPARKTARKERRE